MRKARQCAVALVAGQAHDSAVLLELVQTIRRRQEAGSVPKLIDV